MTDALVISGSAAKGAFAAGAMAELLGCGGIEPTRLVGTSSGGLNATYASAFPHEPEGLVELWRERASALRVFTPPHACRGVSGLDRIRRLIDETLDYLANALGLHGRNWVAAIYEDDVNASWAGDRAVRAIQCDLVALRPEVEAPHRAEQAEADDGGDYAPHRL